jgi:hypothetical protein
MQDFVKKLDSLNLEKDIEDQEFEEVTVIQTKSDLNFWDWDIQAFIYTQEFILLAAIAVVVVISLVIMCVACIASTRKKPRRPPGYDRAATQVTV